MKDGSSGAAARVLIADDDLQFAKETEILLRNEYAVRICSSAEEAIQIQQEGWPDIILLDIKFPGMDGIAALEEIRGCDDSVPVIMLTVYEDIRLVVDAMRKGAYHYVSKAEDSSLLLETIAGALRHRQLQRRCAYLDMHFEEIRGTEGDMIIGPSPASRSLLDDIEKVAATDVGVLIQGETGVGKELVARLIHQKSARRGGPFTPVLVAEWAETMIESHLFGHEKGAFTGAVKRGIGVFEVASGGTILLDEVGDIPLDIQPKLLRVLREKRFKRLGGLDLPEIRCDVRVIAATNRDLEEMVAKKEFRKDLYSRLKVLELRIPPLRERREDIPALVAYFLEKHRVATGCKATRVSDELLKVFQKRPWPLNIPELEHEMIRAMINATGEAITLKDVERTRDAAGAGHEIRPYKAAKYEAVAEFKRRYIKRALEEAGGVVNRAARLAGLPPSSFRKMMRDSGVGGREPERSER